MQVPESQIPDMILGSKLAFMNWIWYMCYIWCLKGVLLCLYWKLTYVPVSLSFATKEMLIASTEQEHGIETWSWEQRASA